MVRAAHDSSSLSTVLTHLFFSWFSLDVTTQEPLFSLQRVLCFAIPSQFQASPMPCQDEFTRSSMPWRLSTRRVPQLASLQKTVREWFSTSLVLSVLAGVVLAAEKRSASKLLDIRKPTEKLYKIDDHIGVVAAGLFPAFAAFGA